MDYVAMQSCTSGRNAFFTGMYPLRTGMIPPQLPGSPSYLRPGTPALAKFLHDLGYTTGEFGKNHLGDHTASLPTSHGFEEYWGYLYHLDAMQQVSFPDINSTPTQQGIAPPCRNTPVPGRTVFRRSGITYCSQTSFETRLSDRNAPSGSEESVDSFQNS